MPPPISTMTNPSSTDAAREAAGYPADLQLSDCLLPDWPVAPRVRAFVTTRRGGVSAAPYGQWRPAQAAAGGLNLGLHTGDDAVAVAANRRRLSALTQATPAWLEQVHGCGVVLAEQALQALQQGRPLQADASITAEPDVACVVMVADCLPVLLADAQGRAVGAAHAGWRGLLDGVIETAATQLAALAGSNPVLHAFLGPAIGPHEFEVGAEVREAFMGAASQAEREATDAAFVPCSAKPGKYLGNLVALAALRLARVGITAPSGGAWCTVTDAERFYSYRRDGRTGRFAGLVWIDRNA